MQALKRLVPDTPHLVARTDPKLVWELLHTPDGGKLWDVVGVGEEGYAGVRLLRLAIEGRLTTLPAAEVFLAEEPLAELRVVADWLKGQSATERGEARGWGVVEGGNQGEHVQQYCTSANGCQVWLNRSGKILDEPDARGLLAAAGHTLPKRAVYDLLRVAGLAFGPVFRRLVDVDELAVPPPTLIIGGAGQDPREPK